MAYANNYFSRSLDFANYSCVLESTFALFAAYWCIYFTVLARIQGGHTVLFGSHGHDSKLLSVSESIPQTGQFYCSPAQGQLLILTGLAL